MPLFNPSGAVTSVGAGAGLSNSGTITAPILDVNAGADGSTAIVADTVQVGILASDAQHGNRGGGGIHANVVAAGAAGFMSGADKSKLDGIGVGAAVVSFTAGAGLANSGTASNPIADVNPGADGSTVIVADTVQVGVLATDAQHGNRGNGTLHSVAVASGNAGFLSGADKAKLDGIAANAIAQWRTIAEQWWSTNLPANTNTVCRFGPNSAQTTSLRASYAGNITAIEVCGDTTITAGSTSVIIQVLINAVAHTAAGEILTVAAAVKTQQVVLATPIAIAVNDDITVRCVTDAGWTATTWDPTVSLWITGTV